MTVPVVTGLYAALCVILNVVLGMNVSRVRGSTKVFLGDGGQEALQRAIRTHGNNAEYTPIAMMMLLVVELLGGSTPVVASLGGSFLLGRLIHPHGLLTGTQATRIIGILLTWLPMLAMAIYALILR